MAEKAMGWLRWPPSEALAADLNAIFIAYEGDVKRINAISGASGPPKAAGSDFRAFMAEHNAARRLQRGSE